MFPLAILITAIWASACTYLYRCLRHLQRTHNDLLKSSNTEIRSLQNACRELSHARHVLMGDLYTARSELAARAESDAHRLIDRAIEGTPIPLEITDLEMVTEKTIVIAPKKAGKRTKKAKAARKARVAR